MIYRNIAQGKNEILATLAIKINRPNAIAYEIYFNGFVDSPRKTKPFFEKHMRSWIKEQLGKFCNQREVGLNAVGMLSMQMIARIAEVRKVASSGGNHLEICHYIVRHQEEFRMLIPSQNSRHYSWAPIIEEIIHYAHEQCAKAHEIQYNYEKQNLHQQ